MEELCDDLLVEIIKTRLQYDVIVCLGIETSIVETEYEVAGDFSCWNRT